MKYFLLLLIVENLCFLKWFRCLFPSVRCTHYGSVLFPQLSCFNTTAPTHFGDFIRENSLNLENLIHQKTKVSKVQYHEGHGWWVHSWSSNWREQTLFIALLCVYLGRVYGSQIPLIFLEFSAWKYSTAQWAQYTTEMEESSSLNHKIGCSVAGIWWVDTDRWIHPSLPFISNLM